MRRYTKDDVEFHSDGFGRRGNPAINVKVRNMPRVADVVAQFNCSEEQAEKALQFAFDSACRLFWEDMPELASEIFGLNLKVYSEGRSGGWYVVHGLPNIESWDAVMLAKWHKLEKAVKAEVQYRTSKEETLADIEANDWWKDGSEQYNFVDTALGVRCIADLKAADKYQEALV